MAPQRRSRSATSNPTIPRDSHAQSLMEEVRMKSSNYGTAVARCVDGRLHKPGCGLEDGDLCQDVYSGVVALLEKDLENS